jgi:hypothetical protein
MRRKPVSHEEVRIMGGRVVTMPPSACKIKHAPEGYCFVGGATYCYEPIERLWRPLVRQLRKEWPRYLESAEYRARKQQHEQRKRMIYRRRPLPPWPPVPPSIPRHEYRYGTHRCQRCGQAFLLVRGEGIGRYCTNACASKARTAGRTAKRAEARAGRVCQVCGEAIEAFRSTKLYCSTKCRVAEHRAAHA